MLRRLAAFTVLLLAMAACTNEPTPQSPVEPFDLVITNGMIYDGHGGDPYMADVAIRSDRIVAIGEDHGDPAGCVTCHGGDPKATDAAAAHAGAPTELTEAGGPHTFYPDPGALLQHGSDALEQMRQTEILLGVEK